MTRCIMRMVAVGACCLATHVVLFAVSSPPQFAPDLPPVVQVMRGAEKSVNWIGAEKRTRVNKSINHLASNIKPAARDKPQTVINLDPTARNQLQTMKIRAELLWDRCEQRRMRSNTSQSRDIVVNPKMFYDDKRKYLLCVNNKVGSSTFRRIILVLNGRVRKQDIMNIRAGRLNSRSSKFFNSMRLINLTRQTRTYMLQHYTKYTYVREPFERLISAYNGKFNEKDTFIQRWYKERITRTLYAAPPVEGYTVTFPDFIRYLVHPQTIRSGYNSHWATYTSVCNPCSVHYDYVGKMETFGDDVTAMLKNVGVNDVSIPGNKSNSDKTKSLLEAYYNVIPVEHIKRLKEIYANDYFLFDFEFPKVLANRFDIHR